MTDISPIHSNIIKVFTDFYHIDFYQREYKWDELPVKILLKDIFDKFNLMYRADIEAKYENIIKEYGWYYLNTYITNQTEGKEYIVDGQQRLTTLTLILIQLEHLAKIYDSKLEQKIERLIYNVGPDGEFLYYMGDKGRSEILEKLHKHELDEIDIDTNSENVSIRNMIKNSYEINKTLSKELYNLHRFDSFIHYFLNKIILINLKITEGSDVPMVFEVINDRGVKLNPHEILKGKLLSKINKNDVDEYCNTWEDAINCLENSEGQKAPDDFFTMFFKSKLASSRAEGRNFDTDYHKAIFKDEYDKILKFNDKSDGFGNVKSFINNDFNYYSKLYCKINKFCKYFDEEQPYIYYNALTQMEAYKLIVFASCNISDKQEDEKIKEISRLWDRHYVLLVLNGVYDSNQIQEDVYTIIDKIKKNNKIEEYAQIFNEVLIDRLKEKRSEEETSSVYNYNVFKQRGYSSLNRTFIRYFLMRIEQYIASKTGHNLQDDLWDYISSRKKDGYDIEHILSRNAESMGKFDTEEEFNEKRNMLGGLLLLKGRDNSASQNEPYSEKLKTYASSLYWNQTLTESFYHCKQENKDFVEFINSELENGLKLTKIDDFDEQALNDRTKILFKLTQLIWN